MQQSNGVGHRTAKTAAYSDATALQFSHGSQCDSNLVYLDAKAAGIFIPLLAFALLLRCSYHWVSNLLTYRKTDLVLILLIAERELWVFTFLAFSAHAF